MFSTNWQTSQREYIVLIDRNVKIPLSDGIHLDSDVFRPDGDGPFPVILGIHPYVKDEQSMEIMPVAFSGERASIETGDFNFYVRRGYVLVIANIRGTHASEGYFGNIDPDSRTIQDIYEVIEWLADQSWCDGNVGMTGISYFAVVQKRVAALRPPHLKAIFAPYGWSDSYRDIYFRGGIMAHGFLDYWIRRYSPDYRVKNSLREAWGDEKYDQAVAAALEDRELTAVPGFKKALLSPDEGCHPLLCEIILNPLYNDYYREHAVDFSADTTIPAYFGGDWKGYGFHLSGDIRAFEKWKGPKKLSIGPGIYLDRPASWMKNRCSFLSTGPENGNRLKTGRSPGQSGPPFICIQEGCSTSTNSGPMKGIPRLRTHPITAAVSNSSHPPWWRAPKSAAPWSSTFSGPRRIRMSCGLSPSMIWMPGVRRNS
ncbi:MAG: CocE/NonD family hydrolase [Deltaproteobacteria bacterium]|nr:CocE/NonD family hydrolase [Deltaproteobacteria bacterium]